MKIKRPMFTKRHYKVIAKVLSDIPDDLDNTVKYNIYNGLCQLFSEDNWNFSRTKFAQASKYIPYEHQ